VEQIVAVEDSHVYVCVVHAGVARVVLLVMQARRVSELLTGNPVLVRHGRVRCVEVEVDMPMKAFIS
jgi:hypothetical protein